MLSQATLPHQAAPREEAHGQAKHSSLRQAQISAEHFQPFPGRAIARPRLLGTVRGAVSAARPTRWLRIADGEQRLRRGLAELYAYFEADAARLAPILRDSEEDALVRELLNLRVTPQLTKIRDVLADGFTARRAAKARLLAVLDLFVSLQTWRLLSSCLCRDDVIETAVRAVRCQQ